MGEIVESDWTLGAIKRREEERLRSELASSPGDIESARMRRAHNLSGDNWVAEAFRRRQEEERAKASQKSASGDRSHRASKEVPVDNWLIEGFKRHQEDERRKEIIARSEDVEAPTGGVVSALDDHIVVEQISLRQDDGHANESPAPRADYSAPAIGSVALVSLDVGMPRKGPGRAPIIVVAALFIVGGLLSLIGLKTTLWGPASAPKPIRAGDAPSAPPAVKQKGSTTNSRSAPVKTGESEPKQPIQPPESSKQNSAAPHAQQENRIGAPALEQAKPSEQNQAAPAPPAPAPVQPTATEPASPPKTDKKLNAEPASVGSETSPAPVRPQQDVSEPKPRAGNTGVDPKSKEKSAQGRHPPRKADGLSTFLKRTANSVRRFFGRLAE